MDNNKKSSFSSSNGGQSRSAPSTSTGAGGKSNYAMIKEGWGNRVNFQISCGLKMTPGDIEEGNKILESFRQADIEAEKAEKSQK